MLSAGQKRRLGLARLMVTGRPIWLLDEPTVSLDTVAVGQFGDMIAGHLDRGGMAVIATHIDLGLGARAETLDLSQFKAAPQQQFNTNEAFL
jgi:heme exporter protein A